MGTPNGDDVPRHPPGAQSRSSCFVYHYGEFTRGERACWGEHRLNAVGRSKLSWQLFPGPEVFVNLQGLLLQSSRLFGISSVQFSSLVISLCEKFLQFSSGHGYQVHPFSSVHSFHFACSSGPGWLGSVRLGSAHRVSLLIVWELRSSSGFPPAEIPARRV